MHLAGLLIERIENKTFEGDRSVTLLKRDFSSLSSVQGHPDVCHARDAVRARQLARFIARAIN